MSYCTGQNIEIARGKALKMLVMEKDLKVNLLFFELNTLGDWNHSILLKYCKIGFVFIDKLLTKI